MKHSEHYPTFIENDVTGQRVIVKTPWTHHKQLLSWGLEGLTPEPEPPAEAVDHAAKPDPDYPKWIEHPKTLQRVLVPNARAEKDQLELWIAKKAATAVNQAKQQAAPATPPKPLTPPVEIAKQTNGTAKTGVDRRGGGGKTAQSQGSARSADKPEIAPPTVEELVAKGYGQTLAQRMADEEIRKYNAGEPPYGKG